MPRFQMISPIWYCVISPVGGVAFPKKNRDSAGQSLVTNACCAIYFLMPLQCQAFGVEQLSQSRYTSTEPAVHTDRFAPTLVKLAITV